MKILKIYFFLVGFLFLSCAEEPIGPLGHDKFPDENFENVSLFQRNSDILAKISIIDKWEVINNKFPFTIVHDFFVEARFKILDSSHQFSKIKINDYPLEPLDFTPPFKYILSVTGKPDEGKGINLLFGFFKNKIYIEGNLLVSDVDTNLSFLTPLIIENIKDGDTINSKNNFKITWSGLNNDFIEIELLPFSIKNENENIYSKKVLTLNDGEFTLTKQDLSTAQTKFYRLIFKRFETYFINLANRKKILVEVQSQVQKCIFIK